MKRDVCQGEFYRHFKNKLYQIIAVAVHSETGEKMVVYQALYGDYGIYVRPYEMFVSEVDHEKYPEVTQKYRFERVRPGADERFDAAETAAESTEPEEPKEPNPDLVAFLDAGSYSERMECLAKLAKTATQSDLNAIYVVLDMKEQSGPLSMQIDGICRYLAAQNRYDGARLR